MDRIYCIVNPSSASGRTSRYWPIIEKKMQIREMEYDYYITEAPIEATLETRRALDCGYQTIVAIGGDGTLNEVVNGFFRNGQAINPQACLAVISCGTGSDFVRCAGIPKDFDLALDIIVQHNIRSIDLGQATFNNLCHRKEERYFINVAGFGVDGEIVERVNHASKSIGGFLSFLKGTLAGLLLYNNKNVSMILDGELIYAGGVVTGVVANGQYFGSGMHIAPNALVADGLFDIVVVGAMSKIDTIIALPRLYTGTHLNLPQVHSYRGSHLTVTTLDSVLLDLDGEQPGLLEAEFIICPQAIKLIC